MSDMDPVLVIDGDILLYSHTAAAEVETNWGDDLWTLHSDATGPKEAIVNAVETLKDKLHSSRVIFTVSDDINFRKEVLESYKSHRKTTRKPLAYYDIREWIGSQYEVVMYPKCEADDVCGILATTLPHCIVVSEDKDLKTVPCTLYRKGVLDEITPAMANYWFLYQTLLGDATDGYKGCPGYGEKTAKRLLDEHLNGKKFNAAEAWNEVVKAYESKDLTEDDAIVQARCARILRKSEWDAEAKEIRLWVPPTRK